MLLVKSYRQMLEHPINFILLACAWLVGFSWLRTIGLLYLGNLLYLLYRQPKQRHHRLSADNEAHYKRHGLNNQDINYFREEMQATLDKIRFIIQYADENSHISETIHSSHVLPLLRAFFKQLKSEPEKLADAASFRYDYLEDLYQCVNDVRTRTKNGTLSSEEEHAYSALILALAQKISEAFEDFIKDEKHEEW